SAVSATGDVAFAVTTPANDRPLLDAGGDTRLTNVAPADANPPGDTVAALVGTTVADADPNPLRGIAVTGLAKATAAGAWKFSVDAGANWLPFPLVTVKTALLLRAEDM